VRFSFAEIRNKTLFITLYALSILVSCSSFYSVVSFSHAEDAEAIRAKGYDVPDGWPAGVFNHGEYYGWWGIEDRPVLFALSVMGLIISIVPLQVLGIRKFWLQQKRR
jgi:hypothetical protein